jgi:hypothetical protein
LSPPPLRFLSEKNKMTIRKITMPQSRVDDTFFLIRNPTIFIKGVDPKNYLGPFPTPRIETYIKPTGRRTVWATGIDIDNAAQISGGMLEPIVSGNDLRVKFPQFMEAAPSARVEFPGIFPDTVLPNKSQNASAYANSYTNITRAQLFAWCRDKYLQIRPGLKNISPEWLNRIAHDAMKKTTSRDLEFRPPYFSFTYLMTDAEYTYDDVVYPFKVTGAVKATGWLFDRSEIENVDPWVKMFKGIEHQIYLYGDGDTVQPNAGGQYKWPFGLTMPIPPTVGNIYVHFLQIYLAKIGEGIGGALNTPVFTDVMTNVAYAIVYPESVNSAQVALGTHVIYSGYGITYGHPEGAYTARLMQENGAISTTQMLAASRDVAAYANRQRSEWISRNQAVFAKAQNIANAGGDIYTLNISQLVEVDIVVTDANGVVVGTGSTSVVDAGSGQGAVVDTPPVVGTVLDIVDYTPGAITPLAVATVKVTSGADTVPAGSSTSIHSPVVSVARDTSPRLTVAQGAYAAAKQAGATNEEAEVAAATAVTTPAKQSSFVPIATILTILSLLN